MKYAIINNSDYDRAKHYVVFSAFGFSLVKKLTYVIWRDIKDNWIYSFETEKERLTALRKAYEATFNRLFKDDAPSDLNIEYMALCEACLDALYNDYTMLTEQKDILVNIDKYVKGQAIYSMRDNYKLTLYN